MDWRRSSYHVEELFGPVFAIIKAKNDEDAIELGNKTPFGLGAAVFTRDIEKGEEIAKKRLQAGSCFVNDYVKSDQDAKSFIEERGLVQLSNVDEIEQLMQD